MPFDRTEVVVERLVAFVKAGTSEVREWFEGLDIFEVEVDATLFPSFALWGMVAAQLLIPVENFSLSLDVLSLRK